MSEARFLERRERRDRRLARLARCGSSLAPQIVDCVIARLGGQGIATVGDIEPHQAQFVSDVTQCTKRAAGTR